MNRTLPCLIAAALSLVAARADDLAGHWRGTWTKAGDPLAVTVTFLKTGDRLSGSFDSDSLQRTGIPFSEVAVDNAKVRYVLTGDATTTVFDGKLEGSALTGTFTEGAVKGTFQLARTVPPPPLNKRDAKFANGDVTLAGDLLLPQTAGRHPAIIFLHGSGAEGRWANRYLAQKFARQGFVALIYDKRGVGESKGDWRQSGFEDLADDAAAGMRYLAGQSEVDPARMGVYGHSQGGTIAPLVASRAQVAFVIASAASGLDTAAVERYSIENSLGVPRLAPTEQADAKRFVHELVDVAYNGKPRAELDAMIARFRNRSWFFEPPAPDHHYWAFSRRIAGFRPLDHWRQVKAPVLIVFGDHDERVPPKQSIEAITATLKAAGNTRTTSKIIPNADHAFLIVPRTPAGGWPKRVLDYTDMLVDWARKQS